jgi:hypothetical protein
MWINSHLTTTIKHWELKRHWSNLGPAHQSHSILTINKFYFISRYMNAAMYWLSHLSVLLRQFAVLLTSFQIRHWLSLMNIFMRIRVLWKSVILWQNSLKTWTMMGNSGKSKPTRKKFPPTGFYFTMLYFFKFNVWGAIGLDIFRLD